MPTERFKYSDCASERMNPRVIFPGTIAEYEAMRGYRVSIVDTGTTDHGIVIAYAGDKHPHSLSGVRLTISKELAEYEALVHAQPITIAGSAHVYGLPVRRS